ncbi:MAG: DUF2442 domain-containing protein [Candidatus Eremiobacteraeota bacterium]|nr:DUF2442 domain-containing protein [Candidatus Eremiobacteraeota bacterium]
MTEEEFEAAARRGEEYLKKYPRATSVRYLPSRDVIVIEMNNGATLSIPRKLMQGLEAATPAQLRRSEIWASGTILSWEELDADFKMELLLEGIFGSPRWMSALASRAGRVKSAAKTKAARINGAKGGRPRKQAVRR